MKVAEIKKTRRTKYGKVTINSRNIQKHEERTLFRLADFGYTVETISPSNIPGSKNPDILMLGTFWEMKGQTSVNEKTITTKFRKAVKQSGGRAIFDLCEAKGDIDKTVKFIQSLFSTTRGMRRIMIIRKDSDGSEIILDINK